MKRIREVALFSFFATATLCANTAVAPFSSEKINLSIQGGALFWRAKQDGLADVIKLTTQQASESLLSSIYGEVSSPNPSLQRGFFVGLCYTVPHDDWDLFLRWTRFRATDENCYEGKRICNRLATTDCAHAQILPLFSPFEASFVFPFCENSNYRLRLDLLQLEQGRDFYVGRELTFRPFIGLLGGIFDQTLELTVASDLNLCFPCNLFGSVCTQTELQNRFRGFGPRGGVATRYLVGKGVSFLGICALSLMYGHYNIKAHSCSSICYENPYSSPLSECTPSQLKDSYFTSKGVADLSIGLEWKQTYMEESWGLGLQVLWDQWLFFNQNALITLKDVLFPLNGEIAHVSNISPRRQGDLSIQGVTVIAEIEF